MERERERAVPNLLAFASLSVSVRRRESQPRIGHAHGIDPEVAPNYRYKG